MTHEREILWPILTELLAHLDWGDPDRAIAERAQERLEQGQPVETELLEALKRIWDQRRLSNGLK